MKIEMLWIREKVNRISSVIEENYRLVVRTLSNKMILLIAKSKKILPKRKFKGM